MHAGQRKVPHLTAKQPPLQQNVVDLSHHRRSPSLSMQVIVSSSTLDASPNLFHHLFSGKPGILDILQRLKDKGPLSTNKAEPCTLPEWELKMFLCSCSLEEWKWCAGQAFQLQLLMTGRHRHCSILSRSTKKWPSCLILSISAVWHERISTSLLSMYMLSTSGKKGIMFGVIFTAARQEPLGWRAFRWWYRH